VPGAHADQRGQRIAREVAAAARSTSP
jgi:hypothetical protein